MIRRPPRSTQSRSSAASDVYKRQLPTVFLIVTGKRGRSMRGAPDPLAVFTLAAYKACTQSGEAPMPQEFEGKVVVVSGGSRGIGRAIAVAFAREGAQTVLAASSAANLAEAAKVVAAAGGPEPMTIAGDLRQLSACLLYTSPSPRD